MRPLPAQMGMLIREGCRHNRSAIRVCRIVKPEALGRIGEPHRRRDFTRASKVLGSRSATVRAITFPTEQERDCNVQAAGPGASCPAELREQAGVRTHPFVEALLFELLVRAMHLVVV
jgi:hypothetical protein